MLTLLQVDVEMPRSLVLDPPLTDAEFEALCAANDLIYFERTREGGDPDALTRGADLPAMGMAKLTRSSASGWKTHRRGRVFDSSGGFFLPDGSMLNPDAAYLLPEKLVGLSRDQLTGFPRLCPDFVIELLSVSDSVPNARQKNGALD